ncbi:Fc.00g075930.m01.CDS01 [Cosmosporella sp. VM-42]
METITNLANTASKAVWGEGETNKEPVSGARGDVAHGEPYDAGNLDPASQKKVENSMTGQSELDPTSASNFHDTSHTSNLGEQSHKSTIGENTENLTFETKSGSHGENLGENTSRSNFGENTSSTNFNETTAKPSFADTSAGQNDTRDPSDPATNASRNQDIDTKTPGLSREAGGLEGDKPRPVETSTHRDDRSLGQDKPYEGIPSTSSSSKPNSGMNLPEKQSSEEGTGEKVVRASGLAADGGDFDATKPGAGREADRLMEQKGVHPGGNNFEGDSSHGHHEKAEKGDKPSIGERIKAKLHKH